MSGPPVVDAAIAPGWRLTRWDYDGAPLVGERGLLDRTGSYSVEIDDTGDLVFDGLDYEGARPYVPAAVLRALVADAIARGVSGWAA